MEDPLEYKAFVISDTEIEGRPRNLVLKSERETNMALSTGAMFPECYLVEGERIPTWSWLNRLLGGTDYETAHDFFEGLQGAVEGLHNYGFGYQLKKFADKHNLHVAKLQIYRADQIIEEECLGTSRGRIIEEPTDYRNNICTIRTERFGSIS